MKERDYVSLAYWQNIIHDAPAPGGFVVDCCIIGFCLFATFCGAVA